MAEKTDDADESQKETRRRMVATMVKEENGEREIEKGDAGTDVGEIQATGAVCGDER